MARKTIAARRRRFVLELSVEESDGAGGVNRSYAPIACLWGTLEALGASTSAARDIAERRELASTYRIVIRYLEGIDGRNRLRLGTRVFEVLSAVDPDGRRRELVLVAQEVMP